MTYSIAYLAHSVETEVLGRQSGIQDQLCAAYGGVNYIEIARRHGARGWKVNGAGGEGGSVTILGGDSSHRTRAMLEEIEASDALYRRVPISLGPDGLRAWKRMLE
ncbi:MAG: hypothetical protein ACJ74T_00080 [Pyrinomonadaceae bacterium]